MSRTLSAPVRVAFDYTRSTGPVLGRFFTGLRDGRLVAARTSDGAVVIPPPEFDPVTHEATTDFVEVAETGTVTSWTWVPEPVAGQPLDRPFAFALVTLDGATAPMLHALDAGSPEACATGMRVRVRWAQERTGHLSDIACFEPAGEVSTGSTNDGEVSTGSTNDGEVSTSSTSGGDEVTGIITPVILDYTYAASPEESAFYRGLAQGKLVAQRCPSCQKVYIPPRAACPTDGTPTTDEVELPHTGTVTTFCIVNVPFLGQRITPPYVSAYILLDGADIAFLHLILDCPADEVRMGMRVKAIWKPEDEWGTTIENISHFAPTGEPDAEFETYRQHL